MEFYAKQHQLVQACSHGRPAAVLDLLRSGASAARSDSNQATPLHWACRSGCLHTARYVLEAPGCDIDAVDSHGRNAVYWACEAAKVELVQLLRPAAQLSTAAKVDEVVQSVKWWQQAEQSPAKAEILTFLYGLSKELAAAAVAQPVAAPPQQEQKLAVKQPAKACCICLEDIAGTSTSISCSSGTHCMCMTCLEGYVTAETGSSKQRIAVNKGKLSCPGDGCSDVFEHQLLARHLPPETFNKLLAAWQACIETVAMQTGAEQAKQELARAAALDDVGKARAHVLDSILMLKCPRCHKAFDDFDGCFAVKCRDLEGNGCGAAFCGYCLKDCGRDAHKHVGERVHNSNAGDLFGTKKDFVAAQCSRRRRMVLAYLETLPLALREEVKPAIAPDLKDLGIDLNKKLQLQQQPKQQAPALPRAAAAAPVRQQQQQAAAAPDNVVYNRVFVNGREVVELRNDGFQGARVFNIEMGGLGAGFAAQMDAVGRAVGPAGHAGGQAAALAGAAAERAGAAAALAGEVAARQGAAVAAAAAVAQRQAAEQQRAAAEQQRAAAAQQREAVAQQRQAAAEQRAAAEQQRAAAEQQRAAAAAGRQQQQQGVYYAQRFDFGGNMVMVNCSFQGCQVQVNGQMVDMARYTQGQQIGAAVAAPALAVAAQAQAGAPAAAALAQRQLAVRGAAGNAI
jgi:Ankyrin repeats (3 copies)